MPTKIETGGGYQAGYDDGNAAGYSNGYNSGYSSGRNDTYNALKIPVGYAFSNGATILKSSASDDGNTASASYTATSEGVYMVIACSGTAQSNGSPYASSSTSGTVIASSSVSNGVSSNVTRCHVIIATLKTGQSIAGSARGSSSYGSAGVFIWKIS